MAIFLLRFNDNRSTLQGKIKTVDSHLNLTGRANWANIEHWTTELNAQANATWIFLLWRSYVSVQISR